LNTKFCSTTNLATKKTFCSRRAPKECRRSLKKIRRTVAPLTFNKMRDPTMRSKIMTARPYPISREMNLFNLLQPH
jgi:hypothetical protein